MNRVRGITCALLGTIVLLFGVSRVKAQAPTPAPASPPAAAAAGNPPPAQEAEGEDDDDKNPFAPEPAPTLPAGMSGSDTNDPRAKLTPGLYDAGETAMGIKHLTLVKKPGAFQLGSSDPDDPKVQKMIGQLGMRDTSKLPR